MLGLYVVHSLFSSFVLHWSQRSERGLSKRLWLAYIGYCVQFLHQCHLSKSLPLTYSTIQTIPNKHYVTTDICHCRLLSNLAKINWIPFFTSRTFRGALIIPVSFPDVKGALTPTVTAAFVDAAPTLWRVKISALTHKPSPQITDAELDFYLSILSHRLVPCHLTLNTSGSKFWLSIKFVKP